ncbi:hypothetical protein AAG906_015652 [Vitis piasezkii]
MRRMQCFLEDADAKQEEDKKVRNWIAEIREVAYDAEDVVENFILHVEKEGKIRGMLASSLYEFQKKQKSLVILDDIWTKQAWDSLKPAFPIGNGGSKIIITTRNKDVAIHVDTQGLVHEPQCLNLDQSWELLKKKAMFPERGPEFGKQMVGICGGLPLAIITLRELLPKKRRLKEWEMMCRNINLYLRSGKGHGEENGLISEVLALSYYDLPYQLKPCFLYLGLFQKDTEVSTKKLIQMWVAEGIVTSMNEEKAEDIAERYLGELIDRCMVEVGARSLTGRVKTCRLHDLMRDLCLLKAKEQSFLQGIHLGHEKEPITVFSSSMVPVMPTGKLRRLSIFLGEHVDGFVPPKNENFSRLRSLLFFNAKDCRIRDWQWAKPVLEEFKLLRVLHLEGFKTEGELPKTIGSLIHLRYLSLKNRCLRTLDLSFALEGYVPKIPNVMWKMLQLRHLYLPSKFTITGATKLRLSDLCHLETLSLLDARKSNVKELVKLTSLRKLQIVSLESFEELEVIFNSPSPILNSLRSLSVEILDDRVEEGNLTQFLQACHNDFYRLSIDGALSKLPDPSKFKPNLSKLRLSKSKLLNDPMATLGKLPHLKVLELWDAYDGKKMLEEWTINAGSLPNLFNLKIRQCEQMERIPNGLNLIATLQKLEIIWMPDAFVNMIKVEVQHVHSISLSIVE